MKKSSVRIENKYQKMAKRDLEARIQRHRKRRALKRKMKQQDEIDERVRLRKLAKSAEAVTTSVLSHESKQKKKKAKEAAFDSAFNSEDKKNEKLEKELLKELELDEKQADKDKKDAKKKKGTSSLVQKSEESLDYDTDADSIKQKPVEPPVYYKGTKKHAHHKSSPPKKVEEVSNFKKLAREALAAIDKANSYEKEFDELQSN